MTSTDSRPPIAPVTRAELEAVYGADGLRRVPVEELPGVITDPGARAHLSEIGLVDAPSAVVSPAPLPLRTLAEALAPHSPAEYWPTLPKDGADLVAVGFSGSATFALDGSTGEVYALDVHEPPTVGGRPAHRGLHSLARCQLAFGATEMLTVVGLLDQEDIDWCREHLAGFAELYPAHLDEEPDEDGNHPGADEDDGDPVPDIDQVFAELAAKLDAVEPGLADSPVWAGILGEFRYGC
ncbi:SUKH-4 family immunity protein [Kitasatospora sp. NA04385]|uniref:SUKH-4 family immunity protein n=1 Tax=Kitasatospora sp. NA04385 TaxID=2742135 RepID=UPI0015924CC6|nr:SUKH-4 family immunity protein [Kitasatospora sp. NA04385]QKW20711.1 SUKH-4 family immunity protein [Kitasatospora sp. NA04385]